MLLMPVFGVRMNWAFSGESLEEIAVLLNRMYNVEVRFLSNKIKGYSFSGVIRIIVWIMYLK